MKYLLSVCLASLALPAQENQYKKYRGTWFEIQYPGNFRIIPSLQSAGVPGAFGSVFFELPDRAVRFYIFAPQWAGENPDIALKDTEETNQPDKKENKDGFRKVWYTIRPKQTGRTRSYLETTNEEGTVRWAIGIEYANRKVYERYLPQDDRFKTALQQFSA